MAKKNSKRNSQYAKNLKMVIDGQLSEIIYGGFPTLVISRYADFKSQKFTVSMAINENCGNPYILEVLTSSGSCQNWETFLADSARDLE